MGGPPGSFGLFELAEPIGRGGMGQVWLARHRLHGTPAAVKVLDQRFADKQEYVAGFEREIRTVAALNHPGIIHVFDLGVVPADAPRELRAGSPWYAMELATHGSLAQLVGGCGWPVIRWVVGQTLDALAHAHARGVVHRDLKPENVLLTRADDGFRFKITDFGLAHTMRRGDVSPRIAARIAGTPGYMSPEQIRGQWRLFGPWTDLYALGSMTWQLCCGKPPFAPRGAEGVLAALQRRLDEPPPAFRPTIDVPHGLEGWLRHLLERNPIRRPRWAADALWAFLDVCEIDEIEAPPEAELVGGGDDALEETIPFEPVRHGPPRSTRSTALSTLRDLVGFEETEFADESWPTREEEPPMPLTWARPSDVEFVPPMGNAGLGIVKVRKLPFVGRFDARDAIWEELRNVRETQNPAGLVVSGTDGVGKSELVAWMVQRAHEVGAALVMRAPHDGSGDVSGLRRMLMEHLGCLGLSAGEGFQHVAKLFEMTQRPALQSETALHVAQVLWPQAEHVAAPTASKAEPPDRLETIFRVVADEASRRPVIVWLDDVEFGGDSLQFARHVLREHADDNVPVLFLMTVRRDLLAERPLDAELLYKLLDLPSVGELNLGPLTSDQIVEMIQLGLKLERELAVRIAERTEGNPLFAIHLVNGLVQNGALEPTPDGFRLADDADELPLPDDISSLWRDRIGQAVEGDEDALLAIEVAAALGETVTRSEWEAACGMLGVGNLDELLAMLSAQDLVERRGRGHWAFAHGLLRETLLRLCETRDDAGRVHRACAEALGVVGEPGGEVEERRARHLYLAGDVERSLKVLQQVLDRAPDAHAEAMRASWAEFTGTHSPA